MTRIPHLNPAEADAAYAAAQQVVETHRRLASWLEPGQTLGQIDQFVADTLRELKCKSCFLGYRVPRLPPFPSHACLSVNECIVHGTAASLDRPLALGDVLKIDIGVSHHGWIGDAAWTYVFGQPSEQVQRLCDAGKRGIRLGIETLHPENTLMAWARTLQHFVEDECGLHLVRGLGGHGYGRQLHSPPFVSNVVPAHAGEWPDGRVRCAPGMLVAVEPMIASGTGETTQRRGRWPIWTADGSMSVHYEHDVLVTQDGPRVLTEGLEELRDVIV